MRENLPLIRARNQDRGPKHYPLLGPTMGLFVACLVVCLWVFVNRFINSLLSSLVVDLLLVISFVRFFGQLFKCRCIFFHSNIHSYRCSDHSLMLLYISYISHLFIQFCNRLFRKIFIKLSKYCFIFIFTFTLTFTFTFCSPFKKESFSDDTDVVKSFNGALILIKLI